MADIVDQFNNIVNTRAIEMIKAKANGLRDNINWSTVTFEKNADGKLYAMSSTDPDLHAWLQRIKITRQ